MKRREFVKTAGISVSGVALAGCLSDDSDEEDTEDTNTQDIGSYPVGFNERTLATQTVLETQIETVSEISNMKSEIVINDIEEIEKQIAKKDGDLRSLQTFINGNLQQPLITRLSNDNTTYIRNNSQASKYSIEKDKVISVKSLIHFTELEVLLSSINIRSTKLENGNIIYDIVGVTNDSTLSELLTSPEVSSFEGQLEVEQDSGVVKSVELTSQNKSITYTFSRNGEITDNYIEEAEESIQPISANIDQNGVLSITTEDTTIPSGSSVLLIPSNSTSTYQTVIDNEVTENSSVYVTVENGKAKYYTRDPDVTSELSSGSITVIIAAEDGSEIKRFTLTNQ